MNTGACVLCAGANPAICTPLQQLLPVGQSRFIAQTAHFAVVPTFGCFVAGYLLVVPRAHVLSFAHLDTVALAEAEGLMNALAARLEAVYHLPVLGFESGIGTRGVRRIEHAHWHLLPSAADLGGWLDERLLARPISSLTALSTLSGASYIAVRRADGTMTTYDPGEAVQAHRRIRLRRAVAALDPRVEDGAWDWAEQRCTPLIRATVADLTAASPADRKQGAGA